MKQTNMDLLVGGSILVALFILVFSIIWLKELSLTREMVQYTVLFPNVGTLQQGDPVMVNGVRKGYCSSIELRGALVSVVIKIDRNVPLTDSSRVIVQNIGLMGERMIGIALSESGKLYLPNKGPAVTQYINGYFDSGLAEAMGMMGTVLAEVEKLVLDAQSLVDSTVGDSAFLTVFHNVVKRVDDISLDAKTLVDVNKDRINKSVSNLEAVSSGVRSLLDDNKQNINTIASNGAMLSNQAVALATQAESVAVALQGIVKSVDRGDGTVGMLLKDSGMYSDLKRTVNTLDSLVNNIKSDGLPVTFKIFGKKKKKN